MALLHKDLPFDLVQIDLSRKPSWYKSVNGRGLVPAVQWQGKTILESVDIVRWLDRTFEGTASLTPHDSALRRAMDDLVDSAAPGVVSAGLDAIAGTTSHSWGIGSAATPSQLSRFEASLAPLASALQASGGPYLNGAQLSVADVVIFPFVERFELALRLFQEYDLSHFAGGSVAQWLGTARVLPAAQLACAPEDRLSAAFQEHRSLDWFDYRTVDVGELHPQLLHHATEGMK